MSPLVDLLARLVALPTVSADSNLACVDLLADRLDAAGARITRHFSENGAKANLLARFGPDEPGGLMLAGHTDVVPTAGQRWSTDPFRLAETRSPSGEPALRGRGACDMKGFIAGAVIAAEALRATDLARPLTLCFTHDEEVGGVGARRLMDELSHAGVPLPETALVGEPTALKIVRWHKGHLQLRVRLRGVGGHSSRPREGVNAIKHAGRVLAYFERLERALASRRSFEGVFRDYPHPVLNVGLISGGAAINMIAEQCEIALGYRLMPEEEPAAFVREVRAFLDAEILPAMRREHPGAGVELIAGNCAPAMATPAGTPLEAAIRASTGDADAEAADFTTEGACYSRAGIVSLVCGPGSIEQAHQPDEHITRDQLERGLRLIDGVIRRLCARPDRAAG
ncbi:MAG: acetylornithine deacetylase [Planctomycetes bacterium]|nr:acetylornithine deacetylase [Planctomycetota bacterium]